MTENKTIVLSDDKPVDMGDEETRQLLDDFGEYLLQFDQVDLPLKHTFTDGVYIREIFIPAGTLVAGKLHRHNHFNFISSGTVTVRTKDGVETLTGPIGMVSTAGTKRALLAHTDVVWTTIHANPTNETDLDKLEAMIVAPSYEALAKSNQLENIL